MFPLHYIILKTTKRHSTAMMRFIKCCIPSFDLSNNWTAHSRSFQKISNDSILYILYKGRHICRQNMWQKKYHGIQWNTLYAPSSKIFYNLYFKVKSISSPVGTHFGNAAFHWPDSKHLITSSPSNTQFFLQSNDLFEPGVTPLPKTLPFLNLTSGQVFTNPLHKVNLTSTKSTRNFDRLLD